MRSASRIAFPFRVAAVAAFFAAAVVAQVTPDTGNAGGPGGPFDVFFINGSNGGADRTVEVGLNKPISFDVIPTGTVSPGALFGIWGFVGVPGPGDVFTLPFGIGQMAFPICPLVGPQPNLLTLVDNFGIVGCPPLLPNTPAPWTVSVPGGLGFPITVALQGVILDPAGVMGFAVTNRVTLNVIDDGIKVIYTRKPGDPTAVVPGATDSAGVPVVTEFRAMEQLVGSPDGTNWLIKGRTQQVGVNETMLMWGSGNTGSVFGQQGRPIPGGAPGEVYDFFSTTVGRFNENNDFAFAARATGGVASIFQKIIKVVGGNGTIAFAMGSPLTGCSDLAPAPSGDEIFGNSVGSAHLLNNGVIGVHDTTIGNVHSSRRPAIFYDQTMFHQINVTSVTTLGGGPLANWIALDSEGFYTTPDGAHHVITGRIAGQVAANDAVLAVDGQVQLQEGIQVGATGVYPSTFVNFDLASNGDWFVRGAQIAPGVGAYAIRNGVPVAKTGDAVVPASAETWATNTFSTFTGNRVGDWVVFGKTNAAVANDDLIVLNGNTIVAREGDPVDINGNGLFDDDAFIGRGNNTVSAFSADNAFLTDDGTLYFFIMLRTGAGADILQPGFGSPTAFVKMRIPHN
jgi:hypothetical protein